MTLAVNQPGVWLHVNVVWHLCRSQNQRRKYCWTHGSCAHNGKEYNRKAEGHKDDASFSNMLGGSSSGCYWLHEWQVGATDSIYKLNRNVSDSSVVAPPKQSSYAILDSGATGNFVATQDLSKLTLLPNNTSHSPIISASGNIMKPSARGQLQLSEKLSPTAQQALVLDDLRTGTLISLSQLCDDDCIAIFTRYNVEVIKNDRVIITGKREPNGLWSIPLLPPVHQANAILRLDKTSTELANFHHASLGSPAKSTLLRAIRLGHLITFPGLTTKLISKHLTPSIATALGHQDQEQKNLRSTQTPLIPDPAVHHFFHLFIRPTLSFD